MYMYVKYVILYTSSYIAVYMYIYIYIQVKPVMVIAKKSKIRHTPS